MSIVNGLNLVVIAGLVLVGIAGVIHVGIFLLESILWRSRRTWRNFGVASEADAEIARPWAFNQGFYNLFLAIGALGGGVGGIVASATVGVASFGWAAYTPLSGAVLAPAIGPTAWTFVAAFSALCMVGAAIVLIASSRGVMLRGALLQGIVPLVGLALIAVGLAV